MSVILINPFEVPAVREDECLEFWEHVAEWRTPEDFQRAIAGAEFQRLTAGSTEQFPDYPSLYEIIRT